MKIHEQLCGSHRMGTTAKRKLAYIGIISMLAVAVFGGEICNSPGWFGRMCAFKCRCQEGACNRVNGSCQLGCQPGWIGPSCQYRAVETFLPSWATDGNASSCSSLQSPITATLARPWSLSWLLVTGKSYADVASLSVTYKLFGNDMERNCPSPKSIEMTISENVTREVFCPEHKPVKSVTISGENGINLCSIEISKGRNFAVKGESIFSDVNHAQIEAPQVVDGRGNETEAETCASFEGQSLVWSLRLLHSVEATLVDIEGLTSSGGMMTLALDARGTNVSYNIDLPTNHSANYGIFLREDTGIFNKLTMQFLTNSTSKLRLCEVKVWGECLGLNCELLCNCKDQSDCSPSGQCLGQCNPGYYGDECHKECEPGVYGPDCLIQCPESCVGGTCDSKTGDCPSDRNPQNKGKNQTGDHPSTEHGYNGASKAIAAIIGFLAVACIIALASLIGVYRNVRNETKSRFSPSSPSSIGDHSWGSNVCDAGEDVQSIDEEMMNLSPPRLSYTHVFKETSV